MSGGGGQAREAWTLTEAGLAALGDHTPAVLRRIAADVRRDPGCPEGHITPDHLVELYELAAATWPELPAAWRDLVCRIAALYPAEVTS